MLNDVKRNNTYHLKFLAKYMYVCLGICKQRRYEEGNVLIGSVDYLDRD